MKQGIVPLVVTLAIQSIASMAILTVPVLAPEAALETGYAASLAGVFIAIVYAGAMAASLVSGDLIGLLGPIRTSQACLVVCAAGLALVSTGMLALMALGAFVLGFGYGPVTPASSHILIRTTPPERMSLIFSLKQTGVPLGGVMAGAIVPAIVSGTSWRSATLVVAGLCLAIAILSQSVRAPLDEGRGAAAGAGLATRILAPLRLIFSSPALRDITLCSFFFCAVQLCVTTFLVIWLTQAYGLDLVAAGMVMAAAQVSGVAGRLLWGWLADRFIPPRMVLSGIGLLTGACMLVFAVSGPDWPLALVALTACVAGATAIGWNGVFLAEVARLAPAGMAGTVTGGSLFFTYLGVVAGPSGFAAILSTTGSFSTAFFAAMAMIVVVGAFLGLSRPRPAHR